MSAPARLCIFTTALGPCGVAWGDGGIRSVALPDARGRLLARLRRRSPDAIEGEPPRQVAEAIADILALLSGEPRDLREIRLDYAGLSAFEARVLEAARSVGPGETITYGALAARAGEPGAARAVGAAMAANPFPIIVPCHRVLAADGRIGGFSAPGGAATKARMLAIERARTRAEPALFDDLPLAIAPRRKAQED